MTDLSSDGEILQVSIINGRNAVIYNQYFKPEHQTEWDDTVPIHHITPERVQDALPSAATPRCSASCLPRPSLS